MVVIAAVYIIYNNLFSGEVNSTVSILMFILNILFIIFAGFLIVYCIIDIIKHEFTILGAIFIVVSIGFLLFKISVIQDIPYFITGDFVHYQGFVELHNAKDTSVHFNDKSNRYKIGSYTKRVLYLDNQDIIATRKRTNIIANLKLNKGAYEVVYLPHTKYLITYKKINDSILLNNVKKLDDYSKTINISKSYPISDGDTGNKYSADVKVTLLSYIPNKYMIEVGKLTGLDYIDTTFDGMAIKIRYDLSNIKSDSKYKDLVSIVPNETQDFVMKDAKGSENGDILYNFNGSVSRQLYYLQDENKDTFKNGDSNTITGWVILFPSKDYATLPISLYIGKGLGDDKDFNEILKFDLPKYYN